MVASIPASAIVTIAPQVLGAGGTGLDLSGLLLTNNTRVPIGTVASFSTSDGVAAFFGAASIEAAKAVVYFGGFTNRNVTPAAMLFAQYPTAAVAAYLRGGNVAGVTLAQLATFAGVLNLTIDGVAVVSGAVNLTGVASFSAAAVIIGTAISGAPGGAGVTVTFDSTSGAFVVLGAAAGAGHAITPATGALATQLRLTTDTGAVVSSGAPAAVPAVFMAALVGQTQDFVSFATIFEPTTGDKIAFAAWNSGTANRFLYVMRDSDITVTTNANTASAGYAIIAAGYGGTAMIYEPTDTNHDVFVMGAIASIDYAQLDGRTNLAFKSQAGLLPSVTNRTIGDQLLANGYNFYGAYATANDRFVFFYNGQVTGPFLWIDSYVNQVKLNNDFQVALMVLLTSVRSIPYNNEGYALIEAALADQINAAVAFGSIRAGVTLSALQAAEVNAAAGARISDVLNQRGWYLQVADAAPTARAARMSPPVTFWFTDGQSVQRLNVASVQIQ
jgi:hypothetical protein